MVADFTHRFLWVALQIEELCHERSDEDIRTAIQNLPRGLTRTFCRALNRIISQNNGKVVQLLLPWISAAKRPLTLDELQDIAGVEINQAHWMQKRRINGIHRVALWFENLVYVDDEADTVHFAHRTIHQFFLGPVHEPQQQAFHNTFEEFDHTLGELCITYLNFSDFQTALTRYRKPSPRFQPMDIAKTATGNRWKWVAPTASILKMGKHNKAESKNLDVSQHMEGLGLTGGSPVPSGGEGKYSFLDYATANWLWHSTNFSKEKSLTWNKLEAMIQSYDDRSSPFWVEILRDADSEHTATNDSKSPRLEVLLAIQLRHEPLLKALETSMLVGSGTYRESHLQMAFDINNEQSVRWLLHREPQPTATEVLPVLAAAMENEKAAMIAILLKAEASTNNKRLTASQDWMNMLLAASLIQGRENLSTELIRRGASGDHQDEYGWTPLHHACQKSLKSVEFLLSLGIPKNLDAQDNDGNTALHVALAKLASGKVDQSAEARGIANALTNAGANVLACNAMGESPAELAMRSLLSRGDHELFKNIVLGDKDVNALDSMCRPLLAVAAAANEAAVVSWLLREGANIEAQDAMGRTALAHAADRGAKDAAVVLVSAGANTMTPDKDGRVPGQLARENGHSETAEYLQFASGFLNSETATRGTKGKSA